MIAPRAYVLAGGRSLRFGSDKARATLGGLPLVVRAARALEPFSRGEVSVVAGRARAYADLGLRTIADREPDLGPLGGLLAALRDAGRGWILLSSCDRVVLEPGWIRTLLSAAERTRAPAVAFRGPSWEPLPACYHTRLAPDVDAALEAGARAMQRLLESAGAEALALPPDWRPDGQVNTRAELRALVEGPPGNPRG